MDIDPNDEFFKTKYGVMVAPGTPVYMGDIEALAVYQFVKYSRDESIRLFGESEELNMGIDERMDDDCHQPVLTAWALPSGEERPTMVCLLRNMTLERFDQIGPKGHRIN